MQQVSKKKTYVIRPLTHNPFRAALQAVDKSQLPRQGKIITTRKGGKRG